MVMHTTNLKPHGADGLIVGRPFRAAETLRRPDAPSRASRARTDRAGLYRRGGKRALETALVLLAAPVILVVLALMAILIALDGHNPFYVQQRLGRDGRVFRMWKLRTMVPDADALLAAHLEADPVAREEWRTTQKLKADPRVTPVGRLLRKTSLDELPQLWNVLDGSMALIGPRPMMPCQRDGYAGRAYFRLRPGVTGLWQISERNAGAFAGRARFDEAYDRSLSLRVDAWIALRSVAVMLRGTGY